MSSTDMSAEEFEGQKAGFISQLTQTDKTLYERSERWWREISRNALDFDSQQGLVDATEALTLADLQAFYRQHLLDPKRSAIVTYSVGEAAQGIFDRAAMDDGTVRIANPAQFRMDKSYFPRGH